MKNKKIFMSTYIIFISLTPKFLIGATGITYGQCSSNPDLLCISDADCPTEDTCIGGSGGTTICTNLNCSSTSWESAQSSGYETRQYKYCSGRYTCVSETEYRCASGYYGSSTNGTNGCTRCPSSNGIYGTSAAGSKLITNCYMPTETILTDETGTFIYTSDCFYTN